MRSETTPRPHPTVYLVSLKQSARPPCSLSSDHYAAGSFTVALHVCSAMTMALEFIHNSTAISTVAQPAWGDTVCVLVCLACLLGASGGTNARVRPASAWGVTVLW